MHAALPALALVAATKSKSSGSSLTFLLIVVVLGAFLIMRRRGGGGRRAQALAQQNRQLEIGREVRTRAGILARVRGFDGEDNVLLEIAPGVVVRMAKTMVGDVLPVPASAEVAGAGESAATTGPVDEALPGLPAPPEEAAAAGTDPPVPGGNEPAAPADVTDPPEDEPPLSPA